MWSRPRTPHRNRPARQHRRRRRTVLPRTFRTQVASRRGCGEIRGDREPSDVRVPAPINRDLLPSFTVRSAEERACDERAAIRTQPGQEGARPAGVGTLEGSWRGREVRGGGRPGEEHIPERIEGDAPPPIVAGTPEECGSVDGVSRGV